MTAPNVAQRGGMKVVRQSFAISSATHRQAIDVTPQVRGVVHGADVSNGLVIANCLHTTCAVLIEEPRPELVEDLVRRIDRLVRDDAPYKHNDALVSDCERGNAAAHLRATLLGARRRRRHHGRGAAAARAPEHRPGGMGRPAAAADARSNHGGVT